MRAAASRMTLSTGVTRAVGVQLHEHATERGKADHGLFGRRRVAFGRPRQRLRDSTFARVARPPPDGDETESELPASVLSLPCRAVLPSSNGRTGIIGTCSGGRHALLAASRAPRFDAVSGPAVPSPCLSPTLPGRDPGHIINPASPQDYPVGGCAGPLAPVSLGYGVPPAGQEVPHGGPGRY
jgi:hypothetical protein